MSDMTVADSNGTWFLNTSLFRLMDPESGTIFEPGVPTKATKTKWITGEPDKDDPTKRSELQPGQIVIVEIGDPSSEDVLAQAAEVRKQADIQKNGPPDAPDSTPAIKGKK